MSYLDFCTCSKANVHSLSWCWNYVSLLFCNELLVNIVRLVSFFRTENIFIVSGDTIFFWSKWKSYLMSSIIKKRFRFRIVNILHNVHYKRLGSLTNLKVSMFIFILNISHLDTEWNNLTLLTSLCGKWDINKRKIDILTTATAINYEAICP